MSQFTPSKTHFDVVIVGFGPTGATLANLLGQQGVSTLVLDREAEAYHLPRAVHFDDEVMRVFQTVGIADELAELCHINPGMKFVAADGTLLLDWPRPQEVTRQGWHASYRFHQPDLEKLLRDALSRYPNVEVGTFCDVTGVEVRDDGGASVSFQHRKSRANRSISARFVVGCDGANSLVQRLIGGGMHDLGFEERWLVVDVLLKRPKPELGDHSVQHCDPVRPATYVRGTGNRRRWEVSVLDDEDSDSIVQAQAVWQWLSKWITPEDAELERQAVYTFKSRVAKRWRSGPMLIAGDAAHLTPPFMGQGMCAGIRDASNLAWKLVHCVRGRGSDQLLDSYQAERAPHAQSYIETAIRLGQLINQADTEAALRSALIGGDGTARMSSITPVLGQGLRAGDDAHRGRLGWQLTMGSGENSDDFAGQKFVLIVGHDQLPLADPVPGLRVITSDESLQPTDYLQDLKTNAILLRPDRYVLGTARTAEELADLLSAVRALT